MKKSRITQVSEFAVAAANCLIAISSRCEVPELKATYLSILLSAGRVEEATKHLLKVTETLKAMSERKPA